MRVQLLQVALLFTAAYAQISSQISSQITAYDLSFDGAAAVSLLWGLDGDPTSTYDFYLCAGDETGAYDTLSQVINNHAYSPGDMVSFRVDQRVGGNEPNAYFLKIVLSGPHNHWSGFTSHFTLTNMKGSFSAKVIDAIKSMQPIPAIAIPWSTVEDEDHLIEAAELTSTFNISSLTKSSSTEAALQFPTPTVKGEAEHNELRKRQVAAVGGVGNGIVAAVDQHTVPYGEQTGSIKYAPMPKSAGTTVATRSATPQYPPFPFSIATTYLGAPTVLYTDTAYATWTANTIENTAAPAPAPTLDKRMQKWLDRLDD